MFNLILASARQILSSLLLATVVWKATQAVYYAYFSPLSKYPGPPFAAVSTLWKLYIELIKGESLSLELVKLHERYGDIIRIGPNEIHFSKPSAYHEIYNQKNRWDKDPALYHAFANADSTFTLLDYPSAKARRDVILPLFSRKSILNLQHLVQECSNKLCEKITEQSKAGKSIDIFRGVRCAVLDATFSFCFARELNTLDSPDFHAELEESMHVAVPGIPVFKHFHILKYIIRSIPPAILAALQPAMKGYGDMKGMLDDQVDEVVANPASLQSVSHPIIYHELLSRENGHEIPSAESLKDEAMLLVNAGVDTGSNALICAIIHILDNPDVYEKLKAELKSAWPTLDEKMKYEDLEDLPYLRACIKECLRLSHGTVTPMTRIVPPGGARISDNFIPAGTIVGISNIFVHFNEDIFPNAQTFKPERWLDNSELDTWLVAFSKGPRSCLGINLAYCDLYILLGNLFRHFDMTLDGTKASDLKWADCYMLHYTGRNMIIHATPVST